MDIQNTQSVEKMVSLGMMQKILKQNLGDGMEFEMVYQSILNQMNGAEGIALGGNSKEDVIRYIGGQNLQDIPFTTMNNSLYSMQGVSSVNRTDLSVSTGDEKMDRIYSAVDKYSKEFGVDPNLVLGVIKAESNFDPNVVSSAGAMGIMQLMPVNCTEDGVQDPFNIEQNIRGGVKQLKGHLDRYNGNTEMALMAYNAGPGTVQRRGVTSVADLYKMPKETQNYVPKVMNYYKNGVK